jgi:cadmium resistance protein CadD (predicted permease)
MAPLQIALTSVIAFIATNLDDLVVLVLLFAPAARGVKGGLKAGQLRPQQIVLGQFLGFAALVLLSLPGFFGGLMVPKPWIGLLGLVPMLLGLRSLLGPNDDDDPALQAVNLPVQKPLFLSPQTYAVAAITIANGGDNIGIYLPLFASLSWLSLLITLGIWFALVGLWCGLAYWLANHPQLVPLVGRYGDRLVPIGLVALGLYILAENQSWLLLWPR